MIKGLHITTNHPLSLKKSWLSIMALMIMVFSGVFGLYWLFNVSRPENVRVTNIGSHSFAISWTTAKAAKGCVTAESQADRFGDENCSDKNTAHLVSLTDLQPATTYQIKINSGLKVFTTTLPQVTTRKVSELQPSLPLPAYGVILEQGSRLPVANALVYLSASNQENNLVLAAKTNEVGGWTVDLSPFSPMPQSLDVEVVTHQTQTLNELSTDAFSPFPNLLIKANHE